MIVLDASVLIAYFDASDSHHQAAQDLLLTIADGPLGASTITIAEVLVGPSRAGKGGQASAVLSQLEIISVPIPADAAPRLAALQVSTGLRLPDCCVLLVAEQTSGSLATFDRRLASSAAAQGLVIRAV